MTLSDNDKNNNAHNEHAIIHTTFKFQNSKIQNYKTEYRIQYKLQITIFGFGFGFSFYSSNDNADKTASSGGINVTSSPTLENKIQGNNGSGSPPFSLRLNLNATPVDRPFTNN